MSDLSNLKKTGIGALVLALATLIGCVPLATTTRPTLEQVRRGQIEGRAADDVSARPGEIQAEVLQVDRPRQELRVRTADGDRRVLSYDRYDVRVRYHGRDYPVQRLESGDIIAFETAPRNSDDLTNLRIQTPVQARGAFASAPRFPPARRAEVVEGTVQAVQHDRGFFDVQPQSGASVKVSVPYNARRDDVASFQSLRRGDYVRVEGEFIGPDTLQLLSFLSPRDR